MNYNTFSDVLIKPKYSEIISRSKVDLSTHLHTIKLGIPIISANMKYVTEHKMAFEMSLGGGMGILHRFYSIEDAVKDYKRSNGFDRGVSIGVQEEDKKRFEELKSERKEMYDDVSEVVKLYNDFYFGMPFPDDTIYPGYFKEIMQSGGANTLRDLYVHYSIELNGEHIDTFVQGCVDLLNEKSGIRRF